MASDWLLLSVFGDFALLMTFFGEHPLEPARSAPAPQNIGTIRGTMFPNGFQGFAITV